MRILLCIFISLFSLQAFSIVGVYLPESEHTPQMCKLYAVNLKKVVTPIILTPDADKKFRITGPAKHVTMAQRFLCSGSVVGTNDVLTAGHCYQKHIEMGKGLETEIKRKEVCKDGNCRPIRGCEMPNWKAHRRCIESIKYFMVESSFEKMKAVCGIKGSTIETRELEWKNGWPQHNFNKKADILEVASFDISVLRTKKPFTIKPLKVVTDFNHIKYLVRNADVCKFQGFGRDMLDQVGVLHAIKMPPNYSLKDFRLTTTSGVNSITSGDSGGSVICRMEDQEYQIAVVSYGNASNPFTTSTHPKNGGFALVAFPPNKLWYDYLMKDLPLDYTHQWNTMKPNPDDLKRRPLAEYVSLFKLKKYFPRNIADLRACAKTFGKAYKRKYYKGYKELADKMDLVLEDVENEYNAIITGAPTITIKEVRLGIKRGMHLGGDFYFDVSIGRSITDSSKYYKLSYVQIRLNEAFKAMNPELSNCKYYGLGHMGDGHVMMNGFKKVKNYIEEREYNNFLKENNL